MPKATKKKSKSNQKYLIVVVALILAGIGYLGYRSILTSPDVNQVSVGEGGGAKVKKKPSLPKAVPYPPKKNVVPKQNVLPKN